MALLIAKTPQAKASDEIKRKQKDQGVDRVFKNKS